MNLKGKGGLQYNLSTTPIAAGGEGEIYNINGQPNLVAKLYKQGKATIDKEYKLVKMVNEPPDGVFLFIYTHAHTRDKNIFLVCIQYRVYILYTST